jgi:hypothetical protein
VKFLSRAFTALNLLPSIAAAAWANRFSRRHCDKLPASRADCRTVVLSEVCDCLEIRRQAPGQPHQLDVALGLSLKPPARSDLVEVAINVDLQQNARVIGRATHRRRRHALKAESRKVQPLNKRLNDLYLVLLRNIVVQIFWQQKALPTILTLDKALHRKPRC